MQNDLVRYSRAGDAFHYRWAARRCLSLISPKSSLKKIVIEGSQEARLAGEYVIDVAEYSQYRENSGTVVHYYQLKHSTRLLHQPFQLSDLKGTLEGFAKRYVEIKKLMGSAERSIDGVRFSVVSNRPIVTTLEGSIRDIAAGRPVNSRFRMTLEKYTGLSGDALRSFCGVLGFVDDEGDFLAQETRVKVSLSRLVAGTVDPPQIDTLITLVANKALPGPKGDGQQGVITREHVLERLGVHSERELFPAPREFEETQGYFRRDQHHALLETVISSTVPVIIHAGAGSESRWSCSNWRNRCHQVPSGSCMTASARGSIETPVSRAIVTVTVWCRFPTRWRNWDCATPSFLKTQT